MKDLRKLVESLVGEYFDDNTQKNAHDYVDFKNPYSKEMRGFSTVDKFKQKHLASTQNAEDNVADIRHLFSKHVIPVLENMPRFSQLIQLEDMAANKIMMKIRLKPKEKRPVIQNMFTFEFRDGMMIIHFDVDTRYHKIYISPEKENTIKSNPDVSSVKEFGDFIDFTYKPFEKLKELGTYREPMEDKGKLQDYLSFMVTSINHVVRRIIQSDLP